MKKTPYQAAIQILLGALLFIILVIGCKNKQASQVSPNADSASSEVAKTQPVQNTKAESKQPIQEKAKSNELDESNKAPQETAEKPSTLLISFYSIGGGIDVKNAQSFDDFISGYKTSNGNSISFERVPWGREGEVDYCVSFSNLNQLEANQFIESSKVKIQDCKLVHFKINGECKRRR